MSGKNNDDHYVGALLEDINHKFDALMEGQQAMASVPGDIAQLKSDMFDVKNDIAAIKAVAKDHEKMIKNHDKRLIRLESAAA